MCLHLRSDLDPFLGTERQRQRLRKTERQRKTETDTKIEKDR